MSSDANLAAAPTVLVAQERLEQTAEAVAGYNAAYAEALGVSVEQGVAYQAEVARAIAADAALSQRPDYRGFRIASGPTFRANFNFTGDGAAALSALGLPATFQSRRVQFSASSVRQALDSLSNALRAANVPLTLYFDDRDERLKVHARSAALLRPIISRLRLPIPIDVIEDDFVVLPTQDVEGGRAAVANDGYTCTSGFSVVHNDGRQGVTTAGHCPDQALRFNGVRVPFVTQLYGDRDIQWHSSPSVTFHPLVWVGTGYLRIQQVTNLPVGAPVCLQGSVNVNRCARVELTNVQGRDQAGFSYANAVTFRRDDNSFVVSRGDSGGSMVTAPDGIGTAHGMQFGGTEPVSTGSNNLRRGLYMKAEDLSRMDVRIMTRPPF